MLRFESCGDKHLPDRGARRILMEYVNIWKLRLDRAERALALPPKQKHRYIFKGLDVEPKKGHHGPMAILPFHWGTIAELDTWELADEIWNAKRRADIEAIGQRQHQQRTSGELYKLLHISTVINEFPERRYTLYLLALLQINSS